MNTRRRDRDVRFEVLDDHLVRTVTFAGCGGPEGGYRHRCTRDVYEAVADVVDAAPAEGEGVTLDALARHLGLPYTQVNVALEFLKERGVAVTRARRSYRASDAAFDDAMVEYHALREKGPEGD